MINTITNPNVRHDFVIIMEGEMCNPNGDPNAGNAPRQLTDDRVYATSTSMGSRINQTAQLLYDAKIMYTAGADIDAIQKDYSSPNDVMRAYWDRRGNGGLFASYGKGKKEVVESGYRGIYRLYPAVSANIPTFVEQAITSPVTNSKGNRTMGNATYADKVYAKALGTYNACLSIKRDNIIDSEYMGQWLVSLWHHAMQTASLQRGRWDIVDCWIFTHSNPYGNTQLSTIDKLIQLTPDGQVLMGDSHDLEHSGVTITRLSDAINELIAKYPPAIG